MFLFLSGLPKPSVGAEPDARRAVPLGAASTPSHVALEPALGVPGDAEELIGSGRVAIGQRIVPVEP